MRQVTKVTAGDWVMSRICFAESACKLSSEFCSIILSLMCRICIAHENFRAGPTLAELEKKAEECEKKANQGTEPHASQLKEEAKHLRTWASVLNRQIWRS